MMADGFGRRQSRRCCVDVACFSSFFFCCLPISHPTLQPEQHHAESVSGHSVILFFFQKKKKIFSPNFLKKKTNGSDLLCRISCNGGWCVSIVCGKPALFLITMFLLSIWLDSSCISPQIAVREALHHLRSPPISTPWPTRLTPHSSGFYSISFLIMCIM